MLLELINKIKKNQSSFKIPVNHNEKSKQYVLEFDALSVQEKEIFLKDDEIIDGLKKSYIFGSFYFIKSLIKSGIFYRESEEEKEIFSYIDELENENMKMWTIDMFFNGPSYKNIKCLYEMDKVNILKEYYSNIEKVPYVDKFKNRKLYYSIFIALAKVAEKDSEYKSIIFNEATKLKEIKIVELLENIKKAIPEIDFTSYSISSSLNFYDLTGRNPLNKTFFKALMMINNYGFKYSFTPEEILNNLASIENKQKQPRISQLVLNNESISRINIVYDLRNTFETWIDRLNLSYKELENLINIIGKANLSIQEYLEPLEIYLTEKIMKFEKNQSKNVAFKINKF